jgi:hypothetical protein
MPLAVPQFSGNVRLLEHRIAYWCAVGVAAQTFPRRSPHGLEYKPRQNRHATLRELL